MDQYLHFVLKQHSHNFVNSSFNSTIGLFAILQKSLDRDVFLYIEVQSTLHSVAEPRGDWGTCPPKSQKSAKIVEEKWHKISCVYLQIEKLRQNPPPSIFRIFQSWRRHWLHLPKYGQKCRIPPPPSQCWLFVISGHGKYQILGCRRK